jgi:hypothetical protein
MSTAVVPLVPPGVREWAVSLIEQARGLVVHDQASLDAAGGYLATEAMLRKKIEDHHAPMKAKAWEAHKEACAMEKRALDENCGPIRAFLTPRITTYRAEQRQLAVERQLRLQAEANRKADDERLALAALLQEQGVSEADVDAVLAAPVEAPHVPLPEVPKLSGGVSERWEYKADLVDLMTLFRAVMAGTVPLAAVEASTKYLNARARSDKENFAIPGCRLLKVPDLTVRPPR